MFAIAKLARKFVPDLLKAHLPARHLRLPIFAMSSSVAQMQKAIVKSLPEDPNLTITLTVGGKQRNLDRPKLEPLEKPLLRIQKSASAPPEKKQRRSAPTKVSEDPDQQQVVHVVLHDGPTPDHPIINPESTTNQDAWVQGRLLRVGDVNFLIDVNPPLVERIDVHGKSFVGIPIVAVPKLLFADAKDCRWKWYKRLKSDSSTHLWSEILGANSQSYIPTEHDIGHMLKVECTPTNKNKDNIVSVGDTVASDEHGVGPVHRPPVPSSAQRRIFKPQLPATSLPRFRVVTYNILADQYASTEAAKTQIFAHCPKKFLDPSYRRPLVLNEILQYNADVICLQEVDEKMFTVYLEPALKLAGFEGAYTNKAGHVKEGSATFWRTSAFDIVQRHDVTLKNLFPQTSDVQDVEKSKYGAVLGPMLKTSPSLCAALQKVATVAQILILQPKPLSGSEHTATSAISNTNNSDDGGGYSGGPGLHPLPPLCVTNTHLFFHYAAPHIRTMHVWAILREASDRINEFISNSLGNKKVGFLFCGDLNSDLNDGIPGSIQLLAQGNLPFDHWDWAFGADFKWERDEGNEGGETNANVTDNNNNTTTSNTTSNKSNGSTRSSNSSGIGEGGEVEKMIHTDVQGLRPQHPHSLDQIIPGVDLDTPFSSTGGLSAVDELRSNVTNYVKGYEGLLDYIWYDHNVFDVENIVPVPHKAELGGYLPNQIYPSDHLAVVADLRYTCASSTGKDNDNGVESSEMRKKGHGIGDEVTGPGCVLPAALYNVGVAAEKLSTSSDGVIAVPTDTIYGFAASANNEAAVNRIYNIKSRELHKPLAICVADYDDIPRYVDTSYLPVGLIQDLLPGSVTLLLSRRSDAPLARSFNPEAPKTLGVRIPDSQFIRAVCRQHKQALALTSANVSGEMSSLSCREFESLWAKCDIVFDGGALSECRDGSTIVDLTQEGQYRIIRHGQGAAQALDVLDNKYKLRRCDTLC